jgi:hypothetical protein
MGVYNIPCECSQVNIEQMGCLINIKLKEHQRHIRLEHPDKSAVAEQSMNLGNNIQLHNNCILTAKTRYVDSVVREAIEIGLHSNSTNREDGFYLSKSGNISSTL